MSISSEITRLSGNVSDALTAISNKGVTVPSGSNSDDLATLIGQISGSMSLQEKTVTPTNSTIVVVPDNGKVLAASTGTVNQSGSSITIQATVDLSALVVGTTYYVVGSGYVSNSDVTDNWEVAADVTFSSSSTVLTFTHSGSFLRQLYVSSTKVMALVGSSGSNQLHVEDLSFYAYSGSAYDGLSKVTVNAIPSGTAGTPTATKGTVSNHSISVTPSVTNTTGYITGSTITGTAVTVSASELVSGSETKTSNGTYDVTNLATLVVNVSGGGSGAQYKKGTYTPSSTYSSAGNREITTLANIGFTPKKFVLYPTDRSDISGISATLVYTMYDADAVIRQSTRYSNTSGSTGKDGVLTAWTTQTNYYLYCDGTIVYFRTGTNYSLVGSVQYTWEAFG